jgi:hypothetical protein
VGEWSVRLMGMLEDGGKETGRVGGRVIGGVEKGKRYDLKVMYWIHLAIAAVDGAIFVPGRDRESPEVRLILVSSNHHLQNLHDLVHLGNWLRIRLNPMVLEAIPRQTL